MRGVERIVWMEGPLKNVTFGSSVFSRIYDELNDIILRGRLVSTICHAPGRVVNR